MVILRSTTSRVKNVGLNSIFVKNLNSYFRHKTEPNSKSTQINSLLVSFDLSFGWTSVEPVCQIMVILTRQRLKYLNSAKSKIR